MHFVHTGQFGRNIIICGSAFDGSHTGSLLCALIVQLFIGGGLRDLYVMESNKGKSHNHILVEYPFGSAT